MVWTPKWPTEIPHVRSHVEIRETEWKPIKSNENPWLVFKKSNELNLI